MAHPFISHVLTKSIPHAAFTLGFHIICCIIERGHFVKVECLKYFSLIERLFLCLCHVQQVALT